MKKEVLGLLSVLKVAFQSCQGPLQSIPSAILQLYIIIQLYMNLYFVRIDKLYAGAQVRAARAESWPTLSPEYPI